MGFNQSLGRHIYMDTQAGKPSEWRHQIAAFTQIRRMDVRMACSSSVSRLGMDRNRLYERCRATNVGRIDATLLCDHMVRYGSLRQGHLVKELRDFHPDFRLLCSLRIDGRNQPIGSTQMEAPRSGFWTCERVSAKSGSQYFHRHRFGDGDLRWIRGNFFVVIHHIQCIRHFGMGRTKYAYNFGDRRSSSSSGRVFDRL